MPKVIEFLRDWFAEVENHTGRLQQVAFRRGTTLLAVVSPAGDGRTANLKLIDGRTARGVPVAHFIVVEESARAA